MIFIMPAFWLIYPYQDMLSVRSKSSLSQVLILDSTSSPRLKTESEVLVQADLTVAPPSVAPMVSERGVLIWLFMATS